ncbi:hypothetical protein ES705_41033 [subsurface metagenome]
MWNWGVFIQAIDGKLLVITCSPFSIPARVCNRVRQPDRTAIGKLGIRIVAVIYIYVLGDILVHLVDKLGSYPEIFHHFLFDSGYRLIHIGSFDILVIDLVGIHVCIRHQSVPISIRVYILRVSRISPISRGREVHVSIKVQVVPSPSYGFAEELGRIVFA